MKKKVGALIQAKGRDVFSIPTDASVYEALEMMADKNVGALVVTRDRELVGIMSERDYARKIILVDRLSKDTAVSEIMTPDPLTVTSHHTTGDCMQLMTERRIRHLPVVDDGELVGVVSIGDVVRAVIEEQEFLIGQLESYITG